MSYQTLAEEVCKSTDDSYREVNLTRADWLVKALEALIENGIEAVRITQLAKSLDVTRGSFYWHFKNRDELLNAIIEVWDRKNTACILSASQKGPDLEGCILSIFEAWLDPIAFDPKLDFAMRDWARGNEKLQAVISKSDRKRLDAIAEMFTSYGFNPKEAEIRARNLYYTQMGYYALNVQERMIERLDMLSTYYETFTGLKLDKQREKSFRGYIMTRRELWGDEILPSDICPGSQAQT